MNFQELYRKIEAIDKGQPVEEIVQNVEGCGDMSPMEPPKQQDNVNMNVSLNASGEGGIRDLLDILQNIESSKADLDMPAVIDGMGKTLDDDYANEPDESYQSVSAVTATGNDLHSKGVEAPKVNGGGNPMAHMERLENLYQEIKLREGEKKTMSRAAKGHEKYGKEGMAALAKAGKAGKDLENIRNKYNKYD